MILLNIYNTLSAHFGPCHWWPGEHPFEVAVGAILTQNTAWRNVEKALGILRDEGALRPEVLWAVPQDELERCLRPSGFYRLKATRLRNLLAWMTGHKGWDSAPENLQLGFLQHKGTDELRSELLGITGVGPETADSILLYALNRPSFVVDAYTRRMVSRHGLLPANVPYEELRAFFMRALPTDRALFNEYHALIVKTGNTFCKARKPLCSQCPLGYLVSHEARF
jgi:endonuclease-3 related protein